jgi:hypothetical protein
MKKLKAAVVSNGIEGLKITLFKFTTVLEISNDFDPDLESYQYLLSQMEVIVLLCLKLKIKLQIF